MIRRENWLLTEKYLKEGIHEEGTRISEDSISRCEFNLKHLLIWADDKPFAEAFESNLKPYCSYIADLPARRGEGNLAQESQKKIINDSKRFLTWVNENPPSKKDMINPKLIRRLIPPKVTNVIERVSVSLDEMLKLASFDCDDNLVYQRDLAAMCLAYLTGARAGAIKSAPIKAIDIAKRRFYQYPDIGVKTKYDKAGLTILLPIPELIFVVKKWDDYVRKNLPENALWYAPFENHWGVYELQKYTGQKSSKTDMGDRFDTIYTKNGMEDLFKSPHKFRHGYAVYCISKCKNMAEYQAVSRNLMHASIKTTDEIYADIEISERERIFSGFTPEYTPKIESDLADYLAQYCNNDYRKAIDILLDKLAG